MIKNIIVTIFTILLLASNGFANSTIPNISKKDAEKTNDDTTQKIIDAFYAYAGTVKPEVREEIQKYRVEIVNINKKKRELYNSLSKEAQNFLAEEQKYKKKLSLSNVNTENDKEGEVTKDNKDKK